MLGVRLLLYGGKNLFISSFLLLLYYIHKFRFSCTDNDVVVIYVLYVAIVYLSSKNSFRCNI